MAFKFTRVAYVTLQVKEKEITEDNLQQKQSTAKINI